MNKVLADLQGTIKVCERSIAGMQDAIATKDFSGYRYCTTELLCQYMIDQYQSTIAECNSLLDKLIKPEDLA